MKHRLLQLSDQEFTLVEEDGGQSMHSRIGPTLEASHIYLSHPHLQILLAGVKPVTLWDVGMGLAANPLLLFKKLRSRGGSNLAPITLFSFENDLDGIRTALEHAEAFPFLKTEKKTVETLLEKGETEVPGLPISWNLRAGDFRSTSRSAPAADLIFYDFYDPKTCRDLWSAPTLKLCLNQLHPDQRTLLLTYVSATWVRLEFLKAGYFVGQGRRTPVKTETTQAANRLDLLESPLNRRWLEHKRKTNPSVVSPVEWDALLAHPQFRSS